MNYFHLIFIFFFCAFQVSQANDDVKPVFDAVQYGEPKELSRLLRCTPANCKNELKDTPLALLTYSTGIYKPRTKTDILLESGGNPLISDFEKNNPMHHIVTSGMLYLAERILTQNHYTPTIDEMKVARIKEKKLLHSLFTAKKEYICEKQILFTIAAQAPEFIGTYSLFRKAFPFMSVPAIEHAVTLFPFDWVKIAYNDKNTSKKQKRAIVRGLTHHRIGSSIKLLSQKNECGMTPQDILNNSNYKKRFSPDLSIFKNEYAKKIYTHVCKTLKN